MTVEIEVDGSLLTFPDGWQVEKLDDWPEQNTLPQPPFHSKGCDVVAMKEDILWFVEVKDYTYPGAKVPPDLAEQVGVKVFHSLAILHAIARWGDGPRQSFSSSARGCHDARICLAVELPDGGRKLMTVTKPRADLFDKLKKVTRKLRMYRPVVSNSHQPNNVPWTLRRHPATRTVHADRLRRRQNVSFRHVADSNHPETAMGISPVAPRNRLRIATHLKHVNRR